jgi:hypothetical protein
MGKNTAVVNVRNMDEWKKKRKKQIERKERGSKKQKK